MFKKILISATTTTADPRIMFERFHEWKQTNSESLLTSSEKRLAKSEKELSIWMDEFNLREYLTYLSWRNTSTVPTTTTDRRFLKDRYVVVKF